MVTKIAFTEAGELLKRGAILLDVRTEEEFSAEHAAGARLLPFDEITAHSAAAVLPDKNAPIIIYCRTGRRSAIAAESLEKLGYTDIRDLGYIAGWDYPREVGE